jgi:hypothetical protein
MRKLVALGLLVMLSSTACGRADDSDPQVASVKTGSPGAAAAAATVDPDAPLKFAKCMRENGIAWFPDPDDNGRTIIRVPSTQDRKKFDAAQSACRQWAPGSENGPQADPAELERDRQMSKCMRENGVPNFPDPRPQGGIEVDRDKVGVGPGDPAFDKADKACSQYRPQGRNEQHSGPGTVGR